MRAGAAREHQGRNRPGLEWVSVGHGKVEGRKEGSKLRLK